MDFTFAEFERGRRLRLSAHHPRTADH